MCACECAYVCGFCVDKYVQVFIYVHTCVVIVVYACM